MSIRLIDSYVQQQTLSRLILFCNYAENSPSELEHNILTLHITGSAPTEHLISCFSLLTAYTKTKHGECDVTKRKNNFNNLISSF